MSAKLDLFSAFADVARALGNRHRLDLLEHLAQGEKCVEVLVAKTGLTVANASQHLQVLRRAGLVAGARSGKQVVYRLADDDVLDLVGSLQAVSERHNQAARQVIGDYFRARDSLDAIPLAALRERLADGLITLIDVRPPDEFAAGHVQGALNIPLAELERRLDELPEDAEAVAYCRGPWCVLAFEAVAMLRRHGRSARRLDGGLPEWRRSGVALRTGLVA